MPSWLVQGQLYYVPAPSGTFSYQKNTVIKLYPDEWLNLGIFNILSTIKCRKKMHYR